MDIFGKIKRLNEIDLSGNISSQMVDAYVIEESLTLEKEILKKFGLPIRNSFVKLLHDEGKLTDFEIDKIIDRLREQAKVYLIEEPSSDLALLRKAQEEKLDPFEVLPELGVTTHVYTIFIYNNYLLTKRESPENVLGILMVCQDDKVLNDIMLFDKTDTQVIDKLEKSGLKYLREFTKIYR